MDSDSDSDGVLQMETGHEEDRRCPEETVDMGTTDHSANPDLVLIYRQMATIEQFMERQADILTSLTDELGQVSVQQGRLNSRQEENEARVKSLTESVVGSGARGNVEGSNPDKHPITGLLCSQQTPRTYVRYRPILRKVTREAHTLG